VFIDPAQLESALLNLGINARDAMPAGGTLTIETANLLIDDAFAARHPELVPGPYVQVAVRDSGVGIAAEILGRVFDPFFTTKAKGKGTGLGLSMVYGFVRQSGGHVTIQSAPGQGTAIEIYLPQAAADDRAPALAPLPAAAQLGGSEHILLVEDDELVRDHAERLLRQLGYRVSCAAGGPQALALLQRGEPVDLLFTDVIMPGGMNGPQLAAAVQLQRPELPVLYTSGYTENAIAHLDPGTLLLHKPYRRRTLAEKIRQALAQRPGNALSE
jgi:CheY-like chemotaxis protein